MKMYASSGDDTLISLDMLEEGNHTKSGNANYREKYLVIFDKGFPVF